MVWNGQYLKALAKDRGISLTKLSENLNVSRQTVNDWIKGQIPKGHHLIQLSTALGANPSYFFSEEVPKPISIPLHRKRGVAKLTDSMKQESHKLALQYESLFKDAPDPGLVQVLRIQHHNDENAQAMAKKLRGLTGIDSQRPIDYQHTFQLLSSLNIVTIFHDFPADIKSYAFYCKIHKHRVIFVNNSTKVLDLIFPLLHDTIHAIRDDEGDLIDKPEEEDFCDEVANYIQFPIEYVKSVADTISGRRINIKINQLKNFGRTNGHSLYGICKQIKRINPSFDLNVGGADTNLKKEFPTIGNILFEGGDARSYIKILRLLSPQFANILISQLNQATKRRFAEWLGLDNILDAKQAIEELQRLSESDSL
jgi:transcriptional regulator with XRE-family HTH domain